MLKLSLLVLSLGLYRVGCCVAIKFPIIIVPDIGGSQIEIRHTRDHQPSPVFCPSMRNWTQAWLRSTLSSHMFAHCFARDMSLVFDANTRTYNDQDGVQVRVPYFGSTESIEYLDDGSSPVTRDTTNYYHAIVQYFVDNAGYVRDESLVAAPYDWRKSPWSMDGYFEKLQALVENITAKYRAPAIVISHGMGAPVLKAFLLTMHSDWRDKYIKVWFSVQGVWLGLPKALQAIVSGLNLITQEHEADLADMERTMESALFLMPMLGLWPERAAKQLVIVDKARKSYGVRDYVEMMKALNMTNAASRLDSVMTRRQEMHGAPGVRLYCMYGTGIDTTWAYNYETLDGSAPTQEILGDGDGIVPLPSMQFCQDWVGKQSQPLVVKKLPKVEHTEAIQNKDVFQYIHAEIDALAEEHA
ncbi:phospholipase A2 group XV-like [Sycon ciliatum]|uniref:phospholipase A2 group XV-like n=1 Tax=Sycon ciliatum TaxID=27933 RepID=UPI0031F70AE7